MTLYIASTNPGKLRDFAAAAAQYAPRSANDRIDLAPLPNLKDIPPPDEDQPTFEGNARLKAVFYSQHLPGQIVLADDSGLEVDALHGVPGVRSARYADDHGLQPSPGQSSPADPDYRNNLCLQQALINIPGPHPARYRCVLAAARDGQILCTAQGSVEGEILSAPRGTEGFGYDPLFYLPALHKTMAELDIDTKLTFSHRGRAFAALLESLPDQIQPPQIQQQST
jgi:XTP/dITP diphosphohydrolase